MDPVKEVHFPIVAVMGPVSNGQAVHPGFMTSKADAAPGLIDTAVLPDDVRTNEKGESVVVGKLPMPGLIGQANVTVFPDLQAPHPVAAVPLFDSFESAANALEAYALKGMKFACAYAMKQAHGVEELIAEVRDEVKAHAEQLSQIMAVHFPEEQQQKADDGGKQAQS